jgi:hypothetical protein
VVVGASAQARECLRLASHHRNDLAANLKCRAQAATMMRHMQNGLRDYRRMQAARDKALAEMHPAAMERAGYWFRDVSVPGPALPEPADTPQPATLTEAEMYATLYPERAARIRANRGLPANIDFGPPEPEIVAALVNGTSPILRALDHRGEPAEPALVT